MGTSGGRGLVALGLGLLLAISGQAAEEAASGALVGETGHSLKVSTQGRVIFSNAKDLDAPDTRATNLLLHENAVRAELDQVDTGIRFTNRFTPGNPRGMNVPFTLEKKWVSWQASRFSLLAGDGYHELGRGIALSLHRDPVFGVDTTLEGGSVRYHPDGLQVAAFAGRVNTARNPVAINPQSDPLTGRQVWLAGTSLTANVTSDIKTGGHYLMAMNRPLDIDRFNRRWHTAGMSLAIDGIVDAVDFYGETNVLVTQGVDGLASGAPNGHGSYASLSYADPSRKGKFELLDYRRYNFDFRRPPTLEDDVVVTLNTQDITAARISSEHRWGSRKAVYGSYRAADDRQDRAAVHHFIAGTKLPIFDRTEMEAKAGYRFVVRKNDMIHWSLKVKSSFGASRALEFEWRKQYSNKALDLTPTVEDRNAYFLTYSFNERWNASAGYEYVPTNYLDDGHHFFNAGGNYRSGPLTAKVFVGQTSGGTLCSGGVCRQVPPYTGAMVEGSYTF